MKNSLLMLLALVLVTVAGCARSEAEHAGATAEAPLSFREIATPAAAGSGEPNLHAASNGEVLLSWIEPAGDGRHALRFARIEDEAWSAPRTIAEGTDWFVNWADFPSLTRLDDGVLAAHFLAKSAAATYAYDVKITRSDDGGATWSTPVTPHRDGTPTEHGFVSMVPMPEGRLLAAWLDGRNTGGDGHGGHGAMTLRAAVLGPDGALSDEAELDARICDCCQTSAVRTPHGVLVAYRDRSEGEIRDIAVVRLHEGRWSAPQPLHADGWEIHGCPVNGPATAAEGARVAVAWFTAAGDAPRIHASFSADEGATFGAPVAVDDGRPIGRVDVTWLPDGAALVTWVEATDEGAEIRARRVRPDGARAPSFTIARTSPARASGFPRLARSGARVYLAWTEAGEPSAVHTAVAVLP